MESHVALGPPIEVTASIFANIEVTAIQCLHFLTKELFERKKLFLSVINAILNYRS